MSIKEKWKRIDDNWNWIKKRKKELIVIVVFPSLLFLYAFLPGIYSLKKETMDNETFIYHVIKPEPNLQFTIRNVIESTFNIKYYKFCFVIENVSQDFITTNFEIIYTDHEPNISYIFVKDDVSKTESIIDGEEKCEVFGLDEKLKFGVNIVSTYKNEKSVPVSVRLDPLPPPKFNLNQRIENEPYSIVTKILLSILGWWGILWLFTRMVRLCQKGIFKV